MQSHISNAHRPESIAGHISAAPRGSKWAQDTRSEDDLDAPGVLIPGIESDDTVLPIARGLARLEFTAAHLWAPGLQTVAGGSVEPNPAPGHMAQSLTAVGGWAHAIQTLWHDLSSRPQHLRSPHLRAIVSRTLDRGHPAACALLRHALQQHNLQQAPVDATSVNLAEELLSQSATCLIATESWNLLHRPRATCTPSLQLAAAVLSHRLTTARPVAPQAWLPPVPLRQWLILLASRRLIGGTLRPQAVMQLVQAANTCAGDHTRWDAAWRDPESILLWSPAAHGQLITFGSGAAIPPDGRTRWVLPWRALFSTLHASGNTRHIPRILARLHIQASSE